MQTIPKIIHQTGPSNKQNWHPLWVKCQNSWIKNYPDYEYKFWNDEDIDNLVKNHYPQYWEMYNNFPAHIMKIDFVRFCFMDHYGGIYADLDYFCYRRFDDLLTESTYIVENPYGNDAIENSLMCSIPNSKFFKKCLEKTLERYTFVKNNKPNLFKYVEKIVNNKDKNKVFRAYIVFYISGTNLISTVFRENRDIVSLLDGFRFNNLDYSYDKEFYTKHVHTGTWGKDDFNNLNLANHFATLRNIPVDNYNFYHDYSNGKYKTSYLMDYEKNDSDPFGLPVKLTSSNYMYN